VALLYVRFLVGMGVSSLIVGGLLFDFSKVRLIQVVQGAALATLVLNLIALWKQEPLRPTTAAERAEPRPRFADAWSDFTRGGRAGRLLAVVALGTVAFSMQDVLLEPFGGRILGLSVSATTLLSTTWAAGAVLGFALAARWLARGLDSYRMGARGLLIGIGAFSCVVLAAPSASIALFFAGAGLIGFGGGLFSVSTLTAAMAMPVEGQAGRGLALGAWGAAQATAAGFGVAAGGAISDLVSEAASAGRLGTALAGPGTGYATVYHIEIFLLFVTLIVLAPLVRHRARAGEKQDKPASLGLAELPT
jgi:BCD family chlorophyll transporter-like MFS transporter